MKYYLDFKTSLKANAPSSQTSAQPNGSASHVDQQSNFEKDVAAMRKALNKIDPLASDKLLSVVMSLKSQLDTATRERVLIAKQAEMLMVNFHPLSTFFPLALSPCPTIRTFKILMRCPVIGEISHKLLLRPA